jgi:hypothetical protein
MAPVLARLKRRQPAPDAPDAVGVEGIVMDCQCDRPSVVRSEACVLSAATRVSANAPDRST